VALLDEVTSKPTVAEVLRRAGARAGDRIGPREAADELRVNRDLRRPTSRYWSTYWLLSASEADYCGGQQYDAESDHEDYLQPYRHRPVVPHDAGIERGPGGRVDR